MNEGASSRLDSANKANKVPGLRYKTSEVCQRHSNPVAQRSGLSFDDGVCWTQSLIVSPNYFPRFDSRREDAFTLLR